MSKRYAQAGVEWQRKKRDAIASRPSKDKIQCLLCGKWYRQVGTHIVQVHKMTAREYRKAVGFDVKKGQLPPDYRELKSQQAIECGGYKNLKKGKKFWFKKGDDGPGKYKRSAETMERLQKQTLHPKKEVENCIVCGNKLTRNQVKYCCKPCRQKDYRVKYNPHKTKLFKK